MFSHFFIRRPVFAMVISIVIILLGTLALKSLPVERYPTIAPPTITVSCSYPGANASTVADTVASQIEQEVNGVENMIYMSSVSANDGSYNLTVTFETGTDLDMANVLVQNRVSVATPKLPQEVQRLGVKTEKKSTDTVMFVAFYSPDERYSDLFLSNYVNLRVKDEIARVPGVGKVFAYGVGDYSIRLWLDPDKLRTRGLSAADVINAVNDQNLQVAAGQVGEPPVPDGSAFQITVNVQGRLETPEEFGDIIIRSNADGAVIRVRDVARVELGASTYLISSQVNGMKAATLAVYQIPGANALVLAEGVKQRLAELEKSFPEGMESMVVYDNTKVITASIDEVVETLFITLILVVLTVYIFLQNFRATLVPAVTIPVSLIGTFAAMSAMGFSINQFTLFGLVLVIGIVVDDAIVVVENTTRHLDETGCTAREAALKAMTEIFGPVIATTLVLLSVFVPTAFMEGITGQLFQQFALTISMATVFSTINALTLSPALCALLLKPTNKEKLNPIFRGFNRGMDGFTKGYSAFVRSALRKAAIGLILFIAMTVAAMYGFVQLPTGFVPQEDEGYCMATVQLPDAASQERIMTFMDKVAGIVKTTPGVENYLTITGYSLLDGAVVPNAGFVVAVFKNWDDRGPEESQTAILQHLNGRLSKLQEGICGAFPMPSIPGVGISGGMTLMLQDRGGVGVQAMEQTGQDFMEAGNSQSGVTGMSSSFRANVQQIEVDVDRDAVLTRGIPLSSVYDVMQNYLGSTYINDVTLFNRSFQVRSQAEGSYRAEPNDIRALEVVAPNGKMVPLGAVSNIRETFGPQTVNRYNMYPSMRIMGQPAEGYSSGQAMGIVEDMAKTNLPDTMGIEWTDLSFQEKSAQGGTTIIFALAVVLVYLVLAAQYESWTLPISVCLAVPTALLGAVLSLFARGMFNDVYAQVGIVLLIGLSTKSAILIVEFAADQNKKGMKPFDAAMESIKLRFRAVLMTAFSFILGVIPLLVATGAGAESRKVLGTVVFGGMLVATCVSLVVVPMLYFVIQTLSDKVKGTTYDTPKEPAEEPAEA